MSERPAALAGVFNNQVVRLLKTGSSDAVKSLVAFGCRPEMGLDLVEEAAERHTFWGWSHAAPAPEGVAAWWYWVDRFVSAMAPAAAQKHLDWALGEAMDVGFAHGSVKPFLCTWRNLQSHAEKGTTPGWTRAIMMGRFLDHVAGAPDKAEPFLLALHQSGLLGESDCAPAARAKCRMDPLEVAIRHGHFTLVEAFLAAKSGDLLASGTHALGLAWSLLPRLPAKAAGAPLSSAIVSAANTVAVLLEGGATWSVPVADGGTVRSQAMHERARFTHPALARLGRAIDARELESTLASASPRAAPRRRL